MDEKEPIETPEITKEAGSPPISQKECQRCGKMLERKMFWNCKQALDGLNSNCRQCMKEMIYVRAQQRNRRTIAHMAESQKNLAHFLIENPKATVLQMSEATGLAVNTINNYLRTEKVLKALRVLSAREITKMLPDSIKAFKDSLRSKNEDIRFKVAKEVLSSEKVLGPTRVDLTVSEMREETTERLMQIVKEAKDFPDQVILEAEVVG